MKAGDTPDLRLEKSLEEYRARRLTGRRGQRLPENRQHRPNGEKQYRGHQQTYGAGDKAVASEPSMQCKARRGQHDKACKGDAATPTHAELAVVQLADHLRERIVAPAVHADEPALRGNRDQPKPSAGKQQITAHPFVQRWME